MSEAVAAHEVVQREHRFRHALDPFQIGIARARHALGVHGALVFQRRAPSSLLFGLDSGAGGSDSQGGARGTRSGPTHGVREEKSDKSLGRWRLLGAPRVVVRVSFLFGRDGLAQRGQEHHILSRLVSPKFFFY